MNLLESLNEDIYMHAFNGVYYHNNYDASKYGGQLFSDYSELIKYPTVRLSHKVFMDKYDLKDCVNTDLVFNYLVMYYNDLNCILDRFKIGIRDPLICYLNKRIFLFSFENRFNILLNIWDDVFSRSIERFLEEKHNLFDESFGYSYKDYFDQHIQKIFYEVYLEVQKESRHTQQIEFKSRFKVYLNNSLTDRDVFVIGLLSEQPEYQLGFLEELAYQCSFQPLLSKH